MTEQAARMTAIAEELGSRYHTRAALSLRERQLDREAEIKRLYMTPPDGWPGKNAEQRDAAKLSAELQDDTLIKINSGIETVKGEASVNNAAIDALEAERRALEWEIRARLVDALSWNHVQGEGGSKVEVAAFDDTLDTEALAQAEQAIAEVDDLGMFQEEEQAWAETGRPPVRPVQPLYDDGMPF